MEEKYLKMRDFFNLLIFAIIAAPYTLIFGGKNGSGAAAALGDAVLAVFVTLVFLPITYCIASPVIALRFIFLPTDILRLVALSLMGKKVSTFETLVF